jgi:BASS family bile acid:Na+ symporter
LIVPMGAAIRRHGMALIAAGALLGIAWPALADLMRPWLALLSLATMALALMRVEPEALSGVLRRPGLAMLVLAWVTLAVPAVVYAVLAPLLPASSPFLVAAMLIAATPSVLSAAVFGILLGADVALLTVVAIPSNALAPVWLPLVASAMGVSAQVDPWDMAVRLAYLVGGSFVLAAGAVRLFGRARIRARGATIDTWIVLLVAINAVPAMDGVGAALAARPAAFAAMLGFALLLNLLLQAVGFLAFLPAPRQPALSAALVSGTRNMVLLLAALGDPGESDIGLIVAAAQLTLFVMPVLVAPAYRALGRPA